MSSGDYMFTVTLTDKHAALVTFYPSMGRFNVTNPQVEIESRLLQGYSLLLHFEDVEVYVRDGANCTLQLKLF